MKKHNPKYTLEEDLEKILKGDQKAFRRFYDRYYPTIYRFARYFLSYGDDCDDVVSEVFCTFWQNRNLLCDLNNIEAYLYIVCRNEAWRVLKQKDKYRNISIDDLPIELSLHSESVENSLIEKEMLDTYTAAVNDLPERCKLIFLMVREEKLKHKEIAKILGIKEGTIEHQINIAIKKILVEVKKYYPAINRIYMLKKKKSL